METKVIATETTDVHSNFPIVTSQSSCTSHFSYTTKSNFTLYLISVQQPFPNKANLMAFQERQLQENCTARTLHCSPSQIKNKKKITQMSINPCLANPDTPCLCKQCRSAVIQCTSALFFIQYVNLNQYWI